MDKLLSGYLERMAYIGDTTPNLDTLRALQRRHLEVIPYENLDILHRIPLKFGTDELWEKIVTRRRGGVCYELNFLFGDMLRLMGFQLDFLSGIVAGGSGGDFSHALLLVHLPEGDYIADVGYARGYLTPFKLHETSWQSDSRALYRLRQEQEWYLLERQDSQKGPVEEYRFTLTPRQREEYREMCDFLCQSPKCKFTYMLVCSLELEQGRLTLRDEFTMMERADAEPEIRPVDSREETDRLLWELFGLKERR